MSCLPQGGLCLWQGTTTRGSPEFLSSGAWGWRASRRNGMNGLSPRAYLLPRYPASGLLNSSEVPLPLGAKGQAHGWGRHHWSSMLRCPPSLQGSGSLAKYPGVKVGPALCVGLGVPAGAADQTSACQLEFPAGCVKSSRAHKAVTMTAKLGDVFLESSVAILIKGLMNAYSLLIPRNSFSRNRFIKIYV